MKAVLLNYFTIIKAEIILFLFGQMALNNFIRSIYNPVPVLKYLGVEIGIDTFIWPGITINCENREKYKLLKIGNHVRILWDVIVDLNATIFIEDYVHIGARSSLITHYSLGKTPLGKTEYPETHASVKILKGSAIAWNCTVLQGSTINQHSIISVGSVVMSDIPAFSVSMGNPARPIKRIIPKNRKDFE